MGDRFYNLVVTFGRLPFWVSSRPVVLHLDRVPRDGAFLLASNHIAPYDVAVLYRHTPRKLDFVSIVELFSKPFIGWFFGNMNAFPLDRNRVDPKTVRAIIERLERGRVVALFPEGRVRKEEDSIVHGKPFRPGIARLARMANVPLIPVVVWGTTPYRHASSWLPLRRVRYGINYGRPIHVDADADGEAAAEEKLAAAFPQLYSELRHAMGT